MDDRLLVLEGGIRAILAACRASAEPEGTVRKIKQLAGWVLQRAGLKEDREARDGLLLPTPELPFEGIRLGNLTAEHLGPGQVRVLVGGHEVMARAVEVRLAMEELPVVTLTFVPEEAHEDGGPAEPADRADGAPAGRQPG